MGFADALPDDEQGEIRHEKQEENGELVHHDSLIVNRVETLHTQVEPASAAGQRR